MREAVQGEYHAAYAYTMTPEEARRSDTYRMLENAVSYQTWKQAPPHCADRAKDIDGLYRFKARECSVAHTRVILECYKALSPSQNP